MANNKMAVVIAVIVLTLLGLVSSAPVTIEEIYSRRDAVGLAQAPAGFFDVSRFAEAKTGEWYRNYTQHIDKSSAKWTSRESEISYFASDVLGWSDLECDLTHKGCIGLPHPEEILGRVNGNLDLARHAYFVLRSAHNMNLIAGVSRDQILASQVNCEGMASSIAHTFFWKFDAKGAAECQLIANMVKAAIVMGASLGGTYIVPPNTKTQLDVEPEKIEASTSKWKFANNGKAVKAWNKVSAGITPSWGYNSVVMIWAPVFYGAPLDQAICKYWPQPAPDAEQTHTREIQMWIQQVSREFRKSIDENMADLNHGAGFGENSSFPPDDQETVLADQIATGEYVTLTPAQRERFVDKPSMIEQDMTTTFRNSIISAALKSQMCHLHCAPVPDAYSQCTPGKSDRYCPDPSTLCQAQCWRDSFHAKNLALFGLDELQDKDNIWNLGIQEFLQTSYELWRDDRYSRVHNAFPSFDDVFHNRTVSTSGSYLPVCYDEFIRPDNFRANSNGHESGHHERKRELPCTCGNRYANETALFHAATRLDQWQFHDRDLGKQCARNMERAKTPAVEDYLTLCAMDTHWPTRLRDRQHWVASGKDIHCDYTQGRVNEMVAAGRTPQEIECWFCSDAVRHVGTLIRKEQRSFAMRLDMTRRIRWNAEKACRAFKKDLGGDEAFSQVCGSPTVRSELEKEWDFH